MEARRTGAAEQSGGMDYRAITRSDRGKTSRPLDVGVEGPSRGTAVRGYCTISELNLSLNSATKLELEL